MCFDGKVLEEILPKIGNDNSQGEYYLTESITIARDMELSCVPVKIGDWREAAGINDLFQLAEATDHLRRRVLERLISSGVRFADPWGCWIEDGVSVEEEAVIGKLVRLSGRTSVGRGARIGDFSSLRDTDVPAFSQVDPFSVLGPGKELQ
jgi:bifunctional UDP-N-acetylglucosamine pyrophosphorylase/glucosamine-1-phosphate N-acetyltransferase